MPTHQKMIDLLVSINLLARFIGWGSLVD